MKIKKALYIVLGCIGVGLGALGAALPLLPAFPFLLLAAFCFAKSSQRLNDWFINTKLYKNNLETYVKGQGMTWKTKIRIMVMVTFLMSIGFIMMSRVPVGRIILSGVWLFHIFYFTFGVKTIKAQATANTIADNPDSCAYCCKIKVSGMKCENCAEKLRCALCQEGKYEAQVDLKTGTATVYGDILPEKAFIADIVRRAGFKTDEICEPVKL